MHIVHILYRFGSFGIVLVGLVKGPTGPSLVWAGFLDGIYIELGKVENI